jgi:hypothetical protein
MAENLKANQEIVSKSTEEFMKFIQDYFIENKISLIDAAMILHNCHKRIVINVATQWSKDKRARDKTFQMFDKTWREAMKDLRHQP